MTHLWHIAELFFLSLGAKYGVNPWIFGAIYVGAIPFFTASAAWLVRNARQKRPILLPLLSASFFFVSAYLYLIGAGRNVPIWVYGVILGIVLGGGWLAAQKIRRRLKRK